ncbi:tigger transposable element-derived protein 6 [Plakobranchus ocellatus]|uniref:Tigger transposable element-derived protein 6 n=1 Tax=Plakobranchus ocellatus TaxID=259542 RepID=A0AAV4BZQ4_9GAST|nr:tigger transposable element-derived protein 6 [Plakobranchus ocellatus]
MRKEDYPNAFDHAELSLWGLPLKKFSTICELHSLKCTFHHKLSSFLHEGYCPIFLQLVDLDYRPFVKKDVKLIVYQHLKNSDQTVSVYKDNTPSDDWASHFIKRHEVLSNRMCQNIKGARAGINPEEVKKYFENLESSLDGVPKGKILNYASSSTIDAPANAASLPALLRASPVCEPAIGSESGDSDEIISEDSDEEWQPPRKHQEMTHCKIRKIRQDCISN